MLDVPNTPPNAQTASALRENIAAQTKHTAAQAFRANGVGVLYRMGGLGLFALLLGGGVGLAAYGYSYVTDIGSSAERFAKTFETVLQRTPLKVTMPEPGKVVMDQTGIVRMDRPGTVNMTDGIVRMEPGTVHMEPGTVTGTVRIDPTVTVRPTQQQLNGRTVQPTTGRPGPTAQPPVSRNGPNSEPSAVPRPETTPTPSPKGKGKKPGVLAPDIAPAPTDKWTNVDPPQSPPQPAPSATVTDFTVFKTVKFGDGSVVSGWKYGSSEDEAPNFEYCYYSPTPTGGITKLEDLAKNGEIVPSAFTYSDVDGRTAAQSCTWFNGLPTKV